MKKVILMSAFVLMAVAANAAGTAAGAGSFVDPWGTAYGYDSSARTITCTPKDASGTAMATVTRYF